MSLSVKKVSQECSLASVQDPQSISIHKVILMSSMIVCVVSVLWVHIFYILYLSMKLILFWHQLSESPKSGVLELEVVTAGAKRPYGASANMNAYTAHWS